MGLSEDGSELGFGRILRWAGHYRISAQDTSVCTSRKTVRVGDEQTVFIGTPTPQYPPNLKCEWLIESFSALVALDVRLDFLALESNYDSLVLYSAATADSEPLAQWSGHDVTAHGTTITSMGPSLLLVLVICSH